MLLGRSCLAPAGKRTQLTNANYNLDTVQCLYSGTFSATRHTRQKQQHLAAAAVAPSAAPRCQRAVLRRASFFQDQFEDVTEEQVTPASPAQPVDLDAADLVFSHPSGVQVCVFGVEHLERQPHIGAAQALD